MLADIHFDPFAGNDRSTMQELARAPVEDWGRILKGHSGGELSPDGADANYALLLSALDAARNAGAHYDYILMTGDLIGHNFAVKYRLYCHADGAGYEDFVIKTMSFVSRTIQEAFPSLPIYAAFGNNDSAAGDYAPQGPRLLAAMQREWRGVSDQPAAKKDFLAGGYYEASHPTVPNFDFIVLNTAFFSSRLSSGDASNADFLELKWLTARLDALRRTHKKAALVMHIPPGIDAYASAKAGQCGNPAYFWKKPAMDGFVAAISAHRDVVADGFAGHTHIDDFRVLTDSSGTNYFETHIAPSISRDHSNRPGFEIGVYDKQSGAMVDYAAEYLNDAVNGAATKPDWKLAYDFRQESHLPGYSAASLETLALLIRSSEAVRRRLMERTVVRGSSAYQAMVRDWRYYSCAQTEMEGTGYGSCVCPN